MKILESIWTFSADNPVVAILLMIAGAVITLVIERAKAVWAYTIALANKRTAKTSEVWEAASKFDAQSTLLLQKAMETVAAGGGKKELLALLPMQEKNVQLGEALKKAAVKNRFFLGNKGYSRVMNFHNAWMDKFRAVIDEDKAALEKADALIEKNRVSLSDVADLYK